MAPNPAKKAALLAENRRRWSFLQQNGYDFGQILPMTDANNQRTIEKQNRFLTSVAESMYPSEVAQARRDGTFPNRSANPGQANNAQPSQQRQQQDQQQNQPKASDPGKSERIKGNTSAINKKIKDFVSLQLALQTKLATVATDEALRTKLVEYAPDLKYGLLLGSVTLQTPVTPELLQIYMKIAETVLPMGKDKEEVEELFYKMFTGVLQNFTQPQLKPAFDYLNVVLATKPDAPAGEGAAAGEGATAGEGETGHEDDAYYANRPPRESTYVIPEKTMETEEVTRHARRMEAECVAARKRDMSALKKLYANAVDDVVTAHLGTSKTAGEIRKLFAKFMDK